MPVSSATTPRDVPTRTARRQDVEPNGGNSGQGVRTRTARRRDVEPDDGDEAPDDGNRAVVRLDHAICSIALTNAVAVLCSWLVRNQEITLGLLCYSRPPGTRSYPTNSHFAVYVVLTTVPILVATGSAFSLCFSSRTNNSQGEPQPDIESGRPADQAVPTPIGRSTNGVVVVGEPVVVLGASSPTDIESGTPAGQAIPTPIVFGIPVTNRGSQPTGSPKAGASQDTQ